MPLAGTPIKGCSLEHFLHAPNCLTLQKNTGPGNCMSFSEIAQQKFPRFCSGGAVHPRQILQSRSKPKMEEVKGRVSIALLASFFRNPQVVGFRSWAVGRNRRAEVINYLVFFGSV